MPAKSKKNTARKKAGHIKIRAAAAGRRRRSMRAAKQVDRKKAGAVRTRTRPAGNIPSRKTQSKFPPVKTGEKSGAPLFSVCRPQAMAPRYFFSTDIPERYNETYMRALPRDPRWVFVYWELSQENIELMRRHVGAETFGKSKWVLRVSDVTDIIYDGTNAWRQMDIELPPYANNWYVKTWEPARTYLIQCGIVTPDNSFFSAVNSNAVRMPGTGVSAVFDEEWLTASTDELIRLSGFKRGFGASENSSEFSAGGIGGKSGSGSIL